ncbi:MAG: FAD binding domain-containing protein [Candidatus Eisenbacteria sp.]|nr:FAD binding domain-containing protein [Candidatus Eisenbacteria bacterium]
MITRQWQVNGEMREATFPALKPLLHVLREELAATGPKEGCGEGECGACTVLLNGQPVTSCLAAAGQVRDGSTIWTAEGLARLPLGERIVDAFMRHGAVQCGICFPGMLATTYAFLRDEPAPDDRSTREALSGNLCRCTGYSKIVAAILDVAREREPAGSRGRVGAQPGPPAGEDPTLETLDALETLETPPSPAAPRAASAPAIDPREPAAFYAPRTLDEALALRARRPGAALLAGGSDLLVAWQAAAREPLLRGAPSRTARPAADRPAETAAAEAPCQRPVVISLSDIDALRGVAEEDGVLRIGACTSAYELCTNPSLARGAPALVAAAHALGARPIRHLATLAGNLVNASPAADLAPPLLVAGAGLLIAKAGGTRKIPLEDFYRGYKETNLGPDEIVTVVLVPALVAGEREGFRKLGTRRAQSIAKVCAAVRVRLDAGRIDAVAIALGSVAPTTVRLPRTEERLRSERPTAALWERTRQWVAEEVHPISDVRSNADYRRAMAGVLVTDLLASLVCSEHGAQ